MRVFVLLLALAALAGCPSARHYGDGCCNLKCEEPTHARGTPEAVAASGSYALAATRWRGELILWDVGAYGRGKHLATTKVGHVTALAFAPDGQRAALGGVDGSLRIVAVPSLEPACSLAAIGSTVRAVTFSPSGNHLISATDDLVRHESLAGRPATRSLRLAGIVDLDAVTDSLVLIACKDGVRLWSVLDDRVTRLEGPTAGVESLSRGRPFAFAIERFRADGERAVRATLWNLETGRSAAELDPSRGWLGFVGHDGIGPVVARHESDQTIVERPGRPPLGMRLPFAGNHWQMIQRAAVLPGNDLLLVFGNSLADCTSVWRLSTVHE